MIKTVATAMQERGNIEPTQEEIDKLEPLKIILQDELSQFNNRKTNLLESAEQKAEKAAQELSEKLNPTDSQD
jgi:hypothetical protein